MFFATMVFYFQITNWFVLLLVSVVNVTVKAALSVAEKAVFEANNVTISESGGDYIFSHSGLPGHDHGMFPNPSNPNTIDEKNHQFRIPKTPSARAQAGCLNNGPIGMAKSGIPFFNPHTIEGYDAVNGGCSEVFDNCKGHPDEQGTYHYHQIPSCISTGANEEILGIALDGYLIYGTKDASGTEPSDLDECGGKEVGGVYRYHARTTLPYLIGCYHGEWSSNNNMPTSCSQVQVCDCGVSVKQAYVLMISCLYMLKICIN